MEKVKQLIDTIIQKAGEGDNVCYFRGEPQKFDIPCSSNLLRFFLGGKPLLSNVTNDTLIQILQQTEEEIYQKAKSFSFFQEKDKVLAEIQHFGGKTNFIDFSANFQVALYFACQEKNLKTGVYIF